MSRLAGSPAGRRAIAVLVAFGAAAACTGTGAVGLPLPLLAACTCAAALGGVALFGARRALLLGGIGVAAFAGALRGEAASTPDAHRVGAHLSAAATVVIGTVRSAAGDGVIVDATRITGIDLDLAVEGGVLARPRTATPLLPGDVVEVDASDLRRPGARPGPDSEAALEREDVEAVAGSPQLSVLRRGSASPARVLAWIQGELVRAVDCSLPEPAAALTLGIAFGVHRPLPADVRAALQDAGLVHIVVVSGLKVVIVIALASALAARLGWSRPRTLAFAAPLVIVYVLLSGSGPAALRSALMAGAALLAATRGRRTAPLPMLALAAAVMLAVSPAVARDVGFQLSFLGTLGIVLFARPLAARLPGPRMLADALAMTVAAQAATVPVMAGSFGVLSPVGPLTNAVVLPVLPLLMVLGGAGALLAVLTPQLAWLPLHAAALGCDLIVALSRLAETIPGGALHLGSWPSSWTLCEVSGCTVAGAFLFFVRNRVATPREAWTSRGAALVAGVAATAMSTFVFTGPDGRMRIVVLDTGSSPAVLVETPDGGTALVDGGSSASLLVTSLGRVLPPTTSHIDMVVVTGGERDAVAGLAGLVGRYSVGAVVAPVQLTAGAAAVITDLQLTGAGVAQGVWSWRWGGASWDCLDDRSTTTGRDLCALRVAASGASALVLGDAAADDQEQLAAVYGPVLRSDLVVSQPGGALSPLLLDAARPSLLAVPLARSGIPAAGLSALPAARTGVDGELTYVAGPAGLVEAG